MHPALIGWVSLFLAFCKQSGFPNYRFAGFAFGASPEVAATEDTATAAGTIAEPSIFNQFYYRLRTREIDLSRGAAKIKVDDIYTIFGP